MPTPQPPSMFWNGVVDPPIEQDASYEFDEFDRGYIDSQIRACETKILAVEDEIVGGGSSPYVINCSAGGTIVYAGPTNPFPLAGLVLSGSPGSAFALEMPTGLGYAMPVLNSSGQTASVYPSGGGGVAVLPASASPVDVFSDGTTTAGPNLLTSFAADVSPVNMSGFTGWGLVAIGAVNQNNAGQQATVPIYGTVLNRFDAATWGLTVPALGSGPVSMQVGEAEFEVVDPGTGNNNLTYGRWAISQSGVFVVSNPEIRFGGTRGDQRATKLTAVYGIPLTGPGAASVYAFDIPEGVTVLTFVCAMRISTAGGPDVLGDAYVTRATFAWSNVGGTITALTVTKGQSFEASQPSGTMVGNRFTPDVLGSQASIDIQTNGSINAGTVVAVQIWVEGINE